MESAAFLRPLAELTAADARCVEWLLTDVDDTITTVGRLHPVALEAMWRLHDAGVRIVCVTGGSAGWGDVYLRQWPVEAVVSESGAVSLYRKTLPGQGQGMITHFIHPSIDVDSYRERAGRLISRVLSEVPGSKLSSDQFARIYDIAFDYGSEPPFLDQDSVDHILAICKEEGASAAVSSIHVNCWFGSFDKREGSLCFMEQVMGVPRDSLAACCGYSGDAPNDQPMFSLVPVSFGVANVLDKVSEMTVLPRYVASARCGEGFAQIVSALLDRRR
ncbi:MAG: haloacid dehalogenase [Sphaerochaetaceae bacterium]|jgi:hydroxymethylpyrimidine pyrophosphatase-like HAD family hydrolase